MPYSKQERERVIKAGYEFYDIRSEELQLRVDRFLEENPWAAPHSNLVFVYIRTLTDYKVISELDGINDIRLRNSLVNSIDKLHKQVFSYRDVDQEDKNNDEMNELFNPLRRAQ